MSRLLLALAFLWPLACTAQTASQRLDRLTSEVTERLLDLFPTSETFARGAGPRQDRLELTFTDEHRERQRALNRWVLDELARIPAAELNPSEKITHALLDYRARDSLEWLSYPFHQHYPFIQLDGGVAFNLIQLISRQPFRNAADYDAWMRRLRRYPAFLDGIAGVMREGLAASITTPRPLVELALKQVEALAPDEIENSSLWKPIAQFPASVDAAARQRIEAEYRALLTKETFPAVRRLAAFMRDDYMPRARTSDGFGALPGGERMYRLTARSSTTSELTPDQIHELGLREVKRIQVLFLAAGAKAGFHGPIKDYGRWLRSQPANYPFTTPDEVIEYLNRIHARIVPQIPRLFSRAPKSRFEIHLTDPAIAANTPAQYYVPALDGSRPGIFAMPVVNPRNVSTAGLAALLAHEGMPGHHFDSGLKLDNNVPEYRRRLQFTAFSEGWALYAESLGHELGLYDEPLQLMGRYSFELFRAGRLVVDTGLHEKGWPREKAVRYLVEECAQLEGGARSEVLRYMAWPGQALSYKIGELTILDLRARAEKRLGARFDIRAFHEVVLGEGHMPLSMLRERVEHWIDEQDKRRL